jgi:branched-chain amino acid transport system permease protein
MGVVAGSLYALLAISWGIIFKTTKIFHFSHGIVYSFAGYLLYALFSILHIPFPLAVLGAIGGTVLLGLLHEVGLYRPLRRAGATPFTILVASLGVLIVMENIFLLLAGGETKPVEAYGRHSFILGPVAFSAVHLVIVVSSLVLILGLMLFLYKTRAGKVMRAVASNPEMAQVVGINTHRVYLWAFAIGSALAAAAAILFTLDKGATPYMGTFAVLIAAIAVIMGGVESIGGGALAGFILGMAMSVSVWRLPSEWQYAIAFGIVILVMILRPRGMFGTALEE